MKIRVHSHEGAATLHPRRYGATRAAMIRMTTMPSFVPLVFATAYVATVEVRYADVTPQTWEYIYPEEHDLIEAQRNAGHAMWVMTDEHAQQIADFLYLVQGQLDLLVVHCDAGISRSSAVATAAAEMYGLDEELERLQSNKRYSPNQYVLSMVRKHIALRKPQ